MRSGILGLGVCGALLFGAAFLLSLLNPLAIERLAREAVRIEVERATAQRIDALNASRLAGLARRALAQTDAQGQAAWQLLRSELPGRVARVSADMLDPDCPCRRRLDNLAGGTVRGRLFALGMAHERLTTLIESGYAHVRARLLREFRIFTASCAAAFAALAAVKLARCLTEARVTA